MFFFFGGGGGGGWLVWMDCGFGARLHLYSVGAEPPHTPPQMPNPQANSNKKIHRSSLESRHLRFHSRSKRGLARKRKFAKKTQEGAKERLHIKIADHQWFETTWFGNSQRQSKSAVGCVGPSAVLVSSWMKACQRATRKTVLGQRPRFFSIRESPQSVENPP